MRELVRFFKALGDETRLHLVALLAHQEQGRAMCVGRLASELGVTASAVSQHLRVLKDLGLVRGERRGYHLHYFVDSERLAAYQDLVREQLGEKFVVPEREANLQEQEVRTMCCRDLKAECCHLAEKQDPQECSPEQIRECHGEVMEHPCEDRADEVE